MKFLTIQKLENFYKRLSPNKKLIKVQLRLLYNKKNKRQLMMILICDFIINY